MDDARGTSCRLIGRYETLVALSALEWKAQREAECRQLLEKLLLAPQLAFDDALRSKLPEAPDTYAIYVKAENPGEVLRAGRTKSAAGGLRQRIYQNHLMGTQSGNLRAQLVPDGQCMGLEEPKGWIRENCTVQFLVIVDEQPRRWAEHCMLSILRPKYSD